MGENFSFGYWLRRQRLARDLRQADLAQQIGVAPITLRKIEADERRPSLQLIARIAELFALSEQERTTLLRVARAELSPAALPLPERPSAAGPNETRPSAPALTLPSGTVNARQHNLPAQTTALIGREHEVARLCALLRQPDVRLVTLIGPGGTGKTRLALQAVAELSEQFAHGVWFVNLAPVSDPALVMPAIAQALNIRELSGLTLSETVHAALRDQQMLLLLDNFEQVVGATPAIATLLAQASQLKLLVTSREALHLSGEWLVAVPPMALPDSHILGTAGTEPAPLIARFEAVRLFVERARTVRADFSVSSANALVVAAICARLEGLPLAIELAAARLRLLSPEALLARLERRLQLLTGGPRDRPARQQTLRGAIAWSYDLLGPAEQRLFRRLGVFVGGCPVGAIELMEGDGASELDALEAIASLVDKSLLRQEDGPEGEPRFLMLETIREYALEQLEACGEEEYARQQHAAFFAELALLAEPELRGPRQYVWLKLLDVEQDNLRAALTWLGARGEAGALARMCAGLWRFWWVRSDWREGRTWLEQALAGLSEGAAPGEEASQLRGALMQALGWLSYGLSDFARARERFTERLALAQAHADRQAQGDALLGLGFVGYGQSNYSWAVDMMSDALSAYQEVGDQLGIVTALNQRSSLAYIQGRLDEAVTDQREALTLARAGGLRGEAATALEVLSQIRTIQGEFEAALGAVRESLALRRELGDQHGVSSCLNSLGELSFTMGQYAQATAHWAEALELRRVIGYRRGTVAMLVCLGRAAWGAGDLAGAARWNVEAIAEARAMHYSQGYHWCLLLGACIAASTKAVRPAAQLLGAMDALAAAFGFGIWPENQAEYDRVVAAARSALSEQDFTATWELGRSLPLDTALEMASQSVFADDAPSRRPEELNTLPGSATLS